MTTGGNEAGAASRDPAASMSLLNHLLNNPLDAGYHAYAQDTASQKSPLWQSILILILAVVLGATTTLAVRNLRAPVRDDVTPTLQRQALDQQATVERLSEEVSTLSASIRAQGATVPDPQLKTDVATDLAAASTAVTGPGITVTVDQAKDTATNTGDRANGQVLDQDLRMVLNALWEGGAEAVSVNGLRVGPDTFVRAAGASILVNITAITAPYRITAIGDANALQVALAQGSSGDYLSTATSVRGIQISVKNTSKLDMDALDPTAAQYASEQTN